MLARLIGRLLGRPSHGVARASAAHDPARTSATGGWLQRGDALERDEKLEAALGCYRECARTFPDEAGAYVKAGNVLLELWRVDEAIAQYAKALELDAGGSVLILSALVFNAHYVEDFDAAELFELHRRYGRLIQERVPEALQHRHERVRDPGRRLRIGYVSPNFSRHSVGYFIEPVIAHHDRRSYEIYCYYAGPALDDTSERIAGLADTWRHVHKMDDDDLADTIAADRIDVLVDLAGHTAMNRLGVFARRPAPVQMTWLGYPDTTGLATIDYRITDANTDPAPDAERRHTERLLRISDLFLTYQPPQEDVRVRVRDEPHVVFCSFNTLEKLSASTIRTWAQILNSVVGSRLLIKARLLKHGKTAHRVLESFSRYGIDASRLELQSWAEDRAGHLRMYDRTDIALDTFPYNGTTTTCEALWMGVPVITRAGSVHMSRVGAALLGVVGLHDLVAQNEADYVRIAIGLANDASRRNELRNNLRGMMQRSALLDHAGFARKLEHEISAAWRVWCDGEHAGIAHAPAQAGGGGGV